MKRVILLIIVNLFIQVNLYSQCPSDKGFETDSFDNWSWSKIHGYDTNFNKVFYCPKFSMPTCAMSGFKKSYFSILSPKQRFNWEIVKDMVADKYGGYYLKNSLPNRVFKLGGDSLRSREGLIKDNYFVSGSDSVLNFRFALVLEDGNHEDNLLEPDSIKRIINPFFGVRIKQTTHIADSFKFVPILTSVEIAKTYPIVSGDQAYWIPRYYDRFNPIIGKTEPSKVNILPWQCGYINLKPFANKNIDIEFVVSDCRDKGHFGYAYIDDVCDCKHEPMVFIRKATCNIVNVVAIPFRRFGGFKNFKAYLVKNSTIVDSSNIINYWSATKDTFDFPISVFDNYFSQIVCDSLLNLEGYSLKLYARDSMGNTTTSPYNIDVKTYIYNTFFNKNNFTLVDYIGLDTISFKFDITQGVLNCPDRCYAPICKFRKLADNFNFNRGFAYIPQSILNFSLIKSDSIIDCERGAKEYNLKYRCNSQVPCNLNWKPFIEVKKVDPNPNAGKIIDSICSPARCDTFQPDTVIIPGKPGYYIPILDEGGDSIKREWVSAIFPDTLYRPYRIICSGGCSYIYEPQFIITYINVPNPIPMPDSDVVCPPRFISLTMRVVSNNLRCDNYVCESNANTILNPFLNNLRGQLLPSKSYIYNTKRKIESDNMRNGESYSEFSPLYSKGSWTKSNDPNWIPQNVMTNYNLSGSPLEIRNPIHIYSSNKYLNQTNSIYKSYAVNSRYKESVALSFEDIDFNKNENDFNWLLQKMSVVNNLSKISTSFTNAHTGRNSLFLKPANSSLIGYVTGFIFLCGPNNPDENAPVYALSDSSIKSVENSYTPEFQFEKDKKYIISYWVMDDTIVNRQNNQGYISIDIDCDSIFNQSPIPSPSIEGWQQKQEEFYVPSNAKSVAISIIPHGKGTYFDDIRIYPADGSMLSYVFDYKLNKMVAQMDDNNYATFYDFDEEGDLIRIRKETDRGIMTISEGRKSMIQK